MVVPPIARKAAPQGGPAGSGERPPTAGFGLLLAMSAGCCALFAGEAVELIHILVIPSYWNAR